MSLLFLASAEVFKRRQGLGPFRGEVASADFITASALAQSIGLTAGTVANNDAPWLKFKDPIDGKTKYVAKKFMRISISWNDINSRGAASGTQISINGQSFIVRLPRTRLVGAGVIAGVVGFDRPATHGSEWNRLMYHISGKPFNDVSNILTSEGIDEGDWAKYSEIDLDIIPSITLCMEKTTDGYVLSRGDKGVSYITFAGAGQSYYGWRPVLELVE